MEDSTTQIKYGYCAPPGKSYQTRHPLDKTDLSLVKDQERNHHRESFSYHRNTGVINGRVNAMLRPNKTTSSIKTEKESSGILSEYVINQVFAHELGHSFGAKHDDLDITCNPSRKNDYIMTGQAKVLTYTSLILIMLL